MNTATRRPVDEARWDVRLFGAFRILDPDGADATPNGRKARALLAYLVLADGQGVPRDRLCALLWSERGDDQARASLRQTFYEMRALTTGDDTPIRIDRTGARAVVERLTSDFRQLCTAPSVDAFAVATLFGDRPADLLVDLDGLDPAFDEWLAAERVRCHHERRRCALAAGERALAVEDAAGAERIARRLLACDATDEAATRIAMEASHRQGDRDAVRRMFMQLCDALRFDLQVEVAEETAALHRRLMAMETPGRPTIGVPRATAANEESSEALAVTSPLANRSHPLEKRSFVASVSRRRATIAGACVIVAACAGYAALRVQRFPAVRTLQVEPLHAATTDSAALALRVGFSADLARLMVGNDATLRVVDASSRDAGSALGTFRVAGDASSNAGLVHATVRVLYDATGPILWSRTFVRPIEEIDALRMEMASKVGDVSICALGRTNSEAATFSPEEMRLMLGACDQKHLGHPEEAIKLFEQLLKRRPGFAHGWAMLAVSKEFGASGRPADAEALEAEAERDVDRALAIDPNDGEAYYARALRLRGIEQWTRKMAILERGHALDPANGQIDNAIGNDLEAVGRWREAAAFHHHAVDADPFGAVKVAELAHVLGFGRDPAGAIVAIEEGRKRFGNHRAIAYADFEFNGLLGDPRRAEAILVDSARGFALPPGTATLWADLITDRIDPSRDNEAKADTALHDAMKSPKDELPLVLETLARTNRIDEAYAFIDRLGLTLRNDLSTDVLFDVLTRSLRADARFMTVAARVGLVPVWEQTGHWPDFCDEAGLAYDCKVEARRAMSADARPLVTARQD